MLVDDKFAVIGSANINDRSMAGNRDSEVAVIIEDAAMISTKMNGADYEASAFVFNLRMRLWSEHLSQNLVGDMTDATHKTFYQHWRNVATTNASLYTEHFRVMPNNEVKTWDEFHAANEVMNRKPPGRHHSTLATE